MKRDLTKEFQGGVSEVVKIREEEGKKLVSGRDLHEFLEVGRDFTTWIKARIEKYGFIENEDFTIISTVPQNGGIAYDYIMGMDMSKELSMVENNDKGREARRYFIACEKAIKQPTQLDLIIQSAEILKQLTDRQDDTDDKLKKLEHKVENVITLDSGKQRMLQKSIACKIYERFDCIKNDNTDNYTCLKRKLFSSIHRELKNKFGVSSYKDVKNSEYEIALKWIENWIESSDIREELSNENE